MFGSTSNEELPRSEDLQRVLSDARSESVRLGHEYIGTEHVLLALVSNHDSAVAVALAAAGVTEDRVRDIMDNTVRHGSAFTMNAEALPFTTRTKAALSRAEDAARELGQAQVTPHHLIVGFMRERLNIAAQVLQRLGLTPEAAEELARRAL